MSTSIQMTIEDKVQYLRVKPVEDYNDDDVVFAFSQARFDELPLTFNYFVVGRLVDIIHNLRVKTSVGFMESELVCKITKRLSLGLYEEKTKELMLCVLRDVGERVFGAMQDALKGKPEDDYKRRIRVWECMEDLDRLVTVSTFTFDYSGNQEMKGKMAEMLNKMYADKIPTNGMGERGFEVFGMWEDVIGRLTSKFY